MKARHSLLITVLFGLIFIMACTFSTKISTPVLPSAEPSAVPERPQSSFIDSRTVSDSSDNSAPLDTSNTSNTSNTSDTGGVGGMQSQAQASGGAQTQYQVLYQTQQQALQPVPVSVYYSPANIYSVPVGCAPRYDWGAYYQIQRGDTLSNIAWRAGVSVQSLAVANCICNPNLIYAGQILRIPYGISYYPPPSYPQYPQYPHYPQYPQYPQYPHYPYPQPQPTYAPPPTYPPPPPVVVGSGLSVTPYDSINNNTINLPPDQLITISWPGTFPTAADHVDFQLIPPGYSSGQSIGMDGNLGDGASIIWNSVNGTQGTLQAIAYFQNGYPPQYSDSYYLIAGTP